MRVTRTCKHLDSDLRQNKFGRARFGPMHGIPAAPLSEKQIGQWREMAAQHNWAWIEDHQYREDDWLKGPWYYLTRLMADLGKSHMRLEIMDATFDGPAGQISYPNMPQDAALQGNHIVKILTHLSEATNGGLAPASEGLITLDFSQQSRLEEPAVLADNQYALPSPDTGSIRTPNGFLVLELAIGFAFSLSLVAALFPTAPTQSVINTRFCAALAGLSAVTL